MSNIRTIKFRGKCDRFGHWHEGGIFKTYKEDEDNNNERYHEKVFIMSDNDPTPNRVDPKTVGQYVGLKDSLGVDIYEGDILRCIDEDRELTWVTVVRYQDTAFVIDIENEEYNVTSIGFINFDYTELQVIGNIHDDPELLPNA